MIAIASLPEINATDTVRNLNNIKSNVENGKIHVGVVGLVASGKRTFLNALLENTFLPFSLHPQTANQVKIVHNPSASEGKLYAAENNETVVATGHEEISKKLAEYNSRARKGEHIFPKLTLNAKFHFVEVNEGRNWEISHIPSLNKATRAITDAVKEMSVFIVVLSMRYLKTESESELIKDLICYHPNIFKKLTRVLIVVNAHDMVFYDDNLEDFEPYEISEFVFEYLMDLGVLVHPKNIVPISSKWALKARVWTADPSRFLFHEDARKIYDEAVILLQKAGYAFTKKLNSFANSLPQDIQAVSSCLLEYSQIEIVEARLREMLYKNGPVVLLEAAVDDTINEVVGLLKSISTKMEGENISTKQAVISSYEQMMSMVRQLHSRHIDYLKPPEISTFDINFVTKLLRETIDDGIDTTLESHLRKFKSHEDKQAVYSQICSVTTLVAQLARREVQSSWSFVASMVKDTTTEYVENAFNKLKASIISDFVSFTNENPSFTRPFSSSGILAIIDATDPITLLPEFPKQSVQIDDSIISSARLNHITVLYVTKWKTVERKKRVKSGLFGLQKRQKTYYGSVPYETAVYSPDFAALRNVFSADATNLWVHSFRTAVDNAITSMSNNLVQAVTEVMKKAFSTIEEELSQALESRRQLLQTSREMVDRFSTSKTALLTIQEDLKTLFDNRP